MSNVNWTRRTSTSVQNELGSFVIQVKNHIQVSVREEKLPAQLKMYITCVLG
jgi:hypothetical protein